MKNAVIDIGSNSVRLMMSQDGKTLYKDVTITRLSEGLTHRNLLMEEAVIRTAEAVSFFVAKARKENADRIYAFATAAARKANNSYLLLDKVKELCGVGIEIISGEKEAEIGVMGALSGKDGGIIDIGGASSEVIVVRGGKTEYCFSLDVGVVKIKEICGQDRDLATKYLKKEIEKYGLIPKTDFYGIGGTATSIAAVMQKLSPYDPSKVHGFVIEKQALLTFIEDIYKMSIEERKTLKGLQPQRAEVIAGGAVLLYEIMDKIGLRHVTVSESDNLEGYLADKELKNE